MDKLFFFLLIYVLIINIVSFAIYGIDKRKAVEGKWRIPEATLLFTGFIGWLMGFVNEKKAEGSLIPGWCIHAVANIFSGICAAFMIF